MFFNTMMMGSGSVSEPESAPEISGTTSFSVVEGTSTSTVLATYTATGTSPITWSVTGTDASNFNINSSGQLTFAVSPDYETTADRSQSINVVATNAVGSDTLAVSVTVTNNTSDDPPVFTNGAGGINFTRQEGYAGSPLVFGFRASGGGTISWSVGGTDGSQFNVNSVGDVSFNSHPDYENPTDSGSNNVYNFSITASNAYGSATVNNTVTITNDTSDDLTLAETGSLSTQLGDWIPTNEPIYGRALAVSGDGNTALVGAEQFDVITSSDNRGAVGVYVRSGSTWSLQAQLDGVNASAQFGYSVALSEDGNTALIGAKWDTSNQRRGAVHVYTRSGTTWSQQDKLTPSTKYQSGLGFPKSIAISADGNTAVMGAYDDNTSGANVGTVWVYTRSGTTWTQQQAIHDSAVLVEFGRYCALSSDGNTLAVSAEYNSSNGSNHKVRVFTRSGNTFSFAQDIETSTGSLSRRDVYSISLSSDGTYIAYGAAKLENPNASNQTNGGVPVFVKSGSTWSESTTVFPETNRNSSDLFGTNVCISEDGKTLAIGSPANDKEGTNQGLVYIFRRSGAVWSQDQLLYPAGNMTNSGFGDAANLALSYDGRTLIAKTRGDDDDAIVFTAT